MSLMIKRSLFPVLVVSLGAGCAAEVGGGPGGPGTPAGGKGDQHEGPQVADDICADPDAPDCYPVDSIDSIDDYDRGRRGPIEEVTRRPGVPVPARSVDLVELQSPVRNQQRRGVCSIFSTVGLMEHLYIVAGRRAVEEQGTEMPESWSHLVDPERIDFSEQFLQWSVKNELPFYPWKDNEGSNANYNLQTIAQNGIVDEHVWPYEGSGWGTSQLLSYYTEHDEEALLTCQSDDPSADMCSCDSDSPPTVCWTNGVPPEGATATENRRKLPAPRWVSTAPESIKNQIANDGTGVIVGLEFHYQAWNHGGARSEPKDHPEWGWCGDVDHDPETPDIPCTLGVNSDHRDRGIVTYPSEMDREFAKAKRAGHSILLIGWDDDMEAPILDRDGEPTDEVARGFFLFKNSWGTGGWGDRHEIREGEPEIPSGYGWISYDYVREFGRGRYSPLPTFQIETEGCDDGLDDDWDGAIDEQCGAEDPGDGQ